MESQDWKGKQLDKDIISPGNKIYSPDTCVFVEPKINKLIQGKKRKVSDFPIGVNLDRGKYKAYMDAFDKL